MCGAMPRVSAALIILILTAANFSAADSGPDAPAEPVIEDIRVPDIRMEDRGDYSRPGLLYMAQVELTFADGRVTNGVWVMSNDTRLTLTNRAGSRMDIRTVSLYALSSIEISRWNATNTGRNTYLFTPVQFLLQPSGGSGFLYNGRLELFEKLVLQMPDDRTAAWYSIFYDSWEAGVKGVFRWENTRSANFTYNLDHPLPGVIVKIRFLNQ